MAIAGSRAATVVVADSLFTYRVHLRGVRAASLARYLRDTGGGSYQPALSRFLDSLGFFNADWDTLATDTIAIQAVRRYVVDTILIKSPHEFGVDSLERLRFPRPYDAGEIGAIARLSVRFLARRGYPYAKLSINLDTTVSADTGNGGEPAPVIRPTFLLDPDIRCVFDRAVFSGDYKTKASLLARDIAFSPGDRFDARLLTQSERRLESRDYIVTARAGAPGTVAIEADSSEGETDVSPVTYSERVAVPFLIEDNSGMGLDGALAFQSDRDERGGLLSGFLTLTLLNIFRRGEAASVYYRGEQDLQQFDLDISKPHLLGMPLVGSAGFGLEIQEDSYGYLHGELELLLEFETLWQTGMAFRGHETADRAGDANRSWRVVGLDLILKKQSERVRAGVLATHLELRTGTAVADRPAGRFQRYSGDISGGYHLPLFRRLALANRAVVRTIIADSRDSLHAVERHRTGGHESVRGYAENEFPFTTVGYLQTEGLFYFSSLGSVYIFVDGGVGFVNDVDFSRGGRTDLLGYGAGIRIPVRIGTASIAWARNYRERRGFGRVHIRVQNALSRGMGR
ncbi:MAG: hypothetical protein GF418_06015 [Chitinivibrionales bacterium]|nr:hypothetical protein [Chitinivibrionales bacterium]